MGKAWDHGVPGAPFWAEFLRVLKPGGHLVAFGGTRTFHRLGVAIEDGGFEIRDCLSWLYGTGFPKVRTVLKPAWEPAIVGRKAMIGTLAANEAAHGTGGLQIDACRIEGPGGGTLPCSRRGPDGVCLGHSRGSMYDAVKHGPVTNPQGRWPANVILDEEAGAALDAQTGTLKSGDVTKTYSATPERSVALGAKRRNLGPDSVYADSGGASRFFYCAKASKAERGPTNGHPTVKPIALMRWIVRLITPPGGLVLDPFAGSGTTGLAARAEGMRAILIEQDASHVQIIRDRLEP